jgi:hypothetical protein
MDARTTRRMREINIAIRIEPPNALTAGDLFIDGVAVQALRMKNPLQLVSPFAPPEYGSGKDNVVWDAASGKGSGLKIFSIKL